MCYSQTDTHYMNCSVRCFNGISSAIGPVIMNNKLYREQNNALVYIFNYILWHGQKRASVLAYINDMTLYM